MAATPAKRMVFDIPRLANITLDGKGEDWGTQGFRVDAMHDISDDGSDTPHLAPSSATMRVGWDARGLLLLLHVVDTSPNESDYVGTLWQRDSIELFMTTTLGGKDYYQLVLAPGVDGRHAEIRQMFYDRRTTTAPKAVPLTCTLARTPTANGYVLKALLPWSNLGVTPAPGLEVGMQAVVNDFDQGALWHKAWYPMTGSTYFSERMYTVRLAVSPSAPDNLQTYCYQERFRRIVVSATDDAAQAGKMFTVHEGRRVLARAPMLATADGHSAAEVLLPFTPAAPPHILLTAGIGEKQFIIDPAPMYFEREKAILRLGVAGSATVFGGMGLPTVDFADPAMAENLLGRYTLYTTFYNAAYQQVSSADAAGRYGALVEVTTENGVKLHRYLTLFRTATQARGGNQEQAFAQSLLQGLGQDPDVLAAQLPSLRRIARQMYGSFSRQPESAVILAGLSEILPDDAPVTERTNLESRDADWWYGLRQHLGIVETYPYCVQHPDGFGKDPAKRYPLIIVLHGAGDMDANFTTFQQHPIDKGLADFTRAKYPAIVVAPFTQMNGWSPQMVDALLSEMLAKEPVDPDRVYLTGFSMGGAGTWHTATAYPQRYAAIIPIAGGGDTHDAAPLKDMPIWAFHGEADDVVNVSQSKNSVQAVSDAGGHPKLTLYPGVGHWSWVIAYGDPALYDWLFQQHRGK